MCGKFEINQNLAQILSAFRAETGLATLSTTSVALPGMNLPVIAKNRLGLAKWGWPLPADTRPLINIRMESVAEKPLFAKDWAAGHLCVAPATAFHEKGRVFAADGLTLFGLCGLWTRDADGHVCFAILTREARDPVTAFHHRMPAAIAPEDATEWCAGGPMPQCPPLVLKDLAASPLLL